MQRKLLLLLLAGCFSFCAYAQDFTVPAELKLEAKEDYAKYEKDVIAAASWLESVPIGQQEEKRQQVSAFVMKWVTGSPTVSISLYSFVVELSDKNPQISMAIIAAYCRYALQHHYSKDEVKCYTAALESAIKLYQLGGEAKKNKKLQKAISEQEKGNLENWVKDNLK